ncbi:MAG: NADH-quinone oxidoreductase subunit A [Candidatus Bathyarchaeia archaeon]
MVAFILVFAASCLIYLLGRYLSPKSAKTEGGQSTYACGEKASFPKLRINVSLSKYLVYFVVLDSSVLLVAFASLALSVSNVLLFMFYLLIMVAAVLLLVEGGDQ